MSNVEKISIALPAEMAALLREAVESGDYASSSEVVRDALRGWKERRALRDLRDEEIRQAIAQSRADPRPPIPAEEVFARLEAKYMKMAKERGET